MSRTSFAYLFCAVGAGLGLYFATPSCGPDSNGALSKSSETTDVDRSGQHATGAAAPGEIVSRAFSETARLSLERTAPEAAQRGGTFTSPFREPGTLNNFTRGDGYAQRLCTYYLFPPLLDVDSESGLIIPEIVSDIPEVDSEGRARWTLRQGITWHRGNPDGSPAPLTTRDIEFSFKLIEQIQDSYPLAGRSIQFVDKLQVVDEFTFETTLRAPFARAVLEFGREFRLMPAHLVTADAEHFEDDPLGRDPVGYGPYRLEKWEPGRLITLVRHRTYPEDRRSFYIERLRFLILGSGEQQLNLFRKGEIDLCSNLSAAAYADAQTDPDLLEKASFHEYYLSHWLYIGWNNEHWAFQDSRVRRAMTHLFPRRKMVEHYYGGYAAVLSGPFAICSDQYDTEVVPLDHDPDKAARLLEEAGFRRGDDGVLARDDQAFKFVCSISSGDPSAVTQVFDEFRANLENQGIVMDLTVVDLGQLINQAAEGDLDAFHLARRPDPVDDDLYEMFHSTMSTGGHNYVNYKSAECDELLKQFRNEADQAQRLELSHQIHAQIHRDLPITPLMTPQVKLLVSSRWRNVSVRKLGARLYDWWLPE